MVSETLARVREYYCCASSLIWGVFFGAVLAQKHQQTAARIVNGSGGLIVFAAWFGVYRCFQ